MRRQWRNPLPETGIRRRRQIGPAQFAQRPRLAGDGAVRPQLERQHFIRHRRDRCQHECRAVAAGARLVRAARPIFDQIGQPRLPLRMALGKPHGSYLVISSNRPMCGLPPGRPGT